MAAASRRGDQVELLEDDADGRAPERGAGAVVHGGDVRAVDSDAAAVGRLEGGHEVEEGRLAGAAFAGEGEGFARVERQAHAVEDRDGAASPGKDLATFSTCEQHQKGAKPP